MQTLRINCILSLGGTENTKRMDKMEKTFRIEFQYNGGWLNAFHDFEVASEYDTKEAAQDAINQLVEDGAEYAFRIV